MSYHSYSISLYYHPLNPILSTYYPMLLPHNLYTYYVHYLSNLITSCLINLIPIYILIYLQNLLLYIITPNIYMLYYPYVYAHMYVYTPLINYPITSPYHYYIPLSNTYHPQLSIIHSHYHQIHSSLFFLYTIILQILSSQFCHVNVILYIYHFM